MSPLSLDSLLVVVCSSAVIYLWWRGVRQRLLDQKGYLFVTTGFTLLLLGLGLDMADNYASTRNFLFIGGVVYSDYLRWYAGYGLGGMLILVGFVRWIPLIVALRNAEEGLRRQTKGLREEIAERKRLESQLLQPQKLESIGRLAGSLAHDFNNLLTPIVGYAELETRALPAGESHLRTSLYEIKRAGERAAELIRQLLAFSRRQVLQARVIDLNELLLGLEELLRVLVGEDIELVAIPTQELGLVKVDPGQIEQMLINLAANARDAMPHGGKLFIETSHVTLNQDSVLEEFEEVSGEYVMLAVTDTGVGMIEEVKARIFEPFFTTKEVGEGAGLGLSTCHGVVKQMGGHITVESEPGQGTTFKIYLPSTGEVTGLPPSSDRSGW